MYSGSRRVLACLEVGKQASKFVTDVSASAMIARARCKTSVSLHQIVVTIKLASLLANMAADPAQYSSDVSAPGYHSIGLGGHLYDLV